MSTDRTEDDSPLSALKSESARQRWEMFHRAIAHAKESNQAALLDAEAPGTVPKAATPLLTIAR